MISISVATAAGAAAVDAVRRKPKVVWVPRRPDRRGLGDPNFRKLVAEIAVAVKVTPDPLGPIAEVDNGSGVAIHGVSVEWPSIRPGAPPNRSPTSERVIMPHTTGTLDLGKKGYSAIGVEPTIVTFRADGFPEEISWNTVVGTVTYGGQPVVVGPAPPGFDQGAGAAR